MASPAPYPPFVHIASVTTADAEMFNAAKDELEQLLGPASNTYGPIDFDSFTSYYEPEMGKGLRKWFLCFGCHNVKGELASLKLATNELELKLSGGDEREVNIDPGVFDRYKLMLASCKNGPMRVPVGSGVYVEVTLQWIDGVYVAHRLTYADWASEEVRTWLASLRAYFEL